MLSKSFSFFTLPIVFLFIGCGGAKDEQKVSSEQSNMSKSVPVSSINVLNSNFADWTDVTKAPNSWNIHGAGEVKKATSNGANTVLIRNTDGKSYCLWQDVSVQAGKKTKFSVKLKASVSGKAFLSILDGTTAIPSLGRPTKLNEFQEIGVSFVPVNGIVRLHIWVEDNQQVEIADVKLLEVN